MNVLLVFSGSLRSPTRFVGSTSCVVRRRASSDRIKGKKQKDCGGAGVDDFDVDSRN